MKLKTQSYGEITIVEEQVLTFPHGIIGFEEYHSYALLDSPTPPFHILQCTTDENLTFILINPYLVEKDFVLEVADEDLATVEFKKEEELLVFAIVTIPNNEPQKISCNLLGPIIINRKNRLACQSISTNNKWSTKHFILEGLETDNDKSAKGKHSKQKVESQKAAQSTQDYAYTQS